MIDYSEVKVGAVLVKEFWIVALVPADGKGFYICGGSRNPHFSPADSDTIFPCITTEEAAARDDFKAGAERMKGMIDGKLVLIKFTGGKVDTMQECEAPGQSSVQT